MRQNQIVTYRIDGVLAERLREMAQAHRFRLRETSQLPACRNLVQSAAPSILVVHLGGNLEQECALLEQIHACMPQTAVIALGDVENPVLAGLVWELGATFVLFPPTPGEMITDILAGLLQERVHG